MSIRIIQQRLRSYNCQTHIEEQQAIREITQEIILAALERGDFFKHVLFQGGTCMRIFYGLNRFSEDMDFLLRQPDPGFRLHDHLRHLHDELSAWGYQVEITDQSKADRAVQKAFIKDSSLGKVLELQHLSPADPHLKKISIRLEVDTNPPEGSGVELQYLDFPFLSAVAAQDLPSLFAGKAHALLCRGYVKGRDWYDFLWYTGRGTGLNEAFLTSAINQTGPWQGRNITADRAWLVKELEKKIAAIDWKRAVDDVRHFIRPAEQTSLGHWSRELFLRQLEKWNQSQG